MLKKILFLGTIFAFGFIFFSLFDTVQAQANPFDIQFPVSELGNCKSMSECKLYCDEPENISACSIFAEKQGLIDRKETGKVKTIEAKFGPGGCKNARECDDYCRVPEHGEECISSAVKEGFISQAEADDILKFMKQGGKEKTNLNDSRPAPKKGPKGPEVDKEKASNLIETVGGPGGCSTFEECDKFCSDIRNDDTCMSYAIEHKLMKTEDIEKFQKLMTIEGPGGCRGRECESYCEQPGHESECMKFAVEQGFMSEDEFQEAKKFLDASEKGGPGGCRGRECEKYCEDQAHGDECFNFAKEHNLLPEEEIQRIEKFKDIKNNLEIKGGPGGCRGEAECRNYCSDMTNFEECAAFSVNAGFVNQDKAKDILRQFVEIEKFRPQGDDFMPFDRNTNPPGEFMPQGEDFGPNSEFNRFGPPPGFEKEFEDRFKQFEQFRGDFEHMPIPPRVEDGSYERFNPPPVFEEEFPPYDQFPGGGEFQPSEFDNSNIEFRQEFQGEFNEQFKAEFENRFDEFRPADGSVYPTTGDDYIKPFDQNFIPPSDGEFYQPSFNDGGYPPPPSDGEFYPPPSGDESYLSPSDEMMLLPTVLFPILPFLKILF
ncbi:MAG: hypothetical protein COU71_01970 [Parcubacteria group bacterium CG10_big_fil_rev_8_21_14_0_10_38_31]|nr:MAG: hypothetical protein COU71_01970 [Parcubacteria group bacterium CG10_big_fil_rev_8_21_14_0_10_38_31]